MPELLTAAAFEQRIPLLSERLDALRAEARNTNTSQLPYAGLELGELLPELSEILVSLLNQEPDEPLTTNPRLQVGARRIGLAALTYLLQGGEGLADFPARYKKALGAEPDNAQLESFLPAALREAGVPLPSKLEARRLLDTLLKAAGLPSGLLTAVAEYFVEYWKLFHPLPQPLAPLATLDAWNLEPDTRQRLAALAKRLLPNSGVVGPVLESLVGVMGYLRTQSRWRAGDLFEAAESIASGCGINPKQLLQGNEEALAILAAALAHAWHPVQFRHLLAGLPRGGEVRLPNGSLSMVERAIALPHWGLYRIEHKTYMVLPNEGMTLDELKTLPENEILVRGNRAVWRGSDEADVCADGWPLLQYPRHAFEERQSLGWCYYELPPNARSLKIGKQTLNPLPGVHWRSALLATLSDGQPKLHARVDGLRVCLPEFANTTLQLECPQAETAGRLTFDLDERGVGGLPDLLLSVPAPSAGTLEVFLQDHASGTVIEHVGQPVVRRVSFPEIMLFFEGSGTPVAPSPTPYPYGLASYLLFASRPINTDALELLDVGTEALGRTGDYDVYRLTWRQPDQVFSIVLDAQFSWTFSNRVETAWQAGDLPAARPPFRFVAERPEGYTVTTVDDLFVDDVSMVENPLVVISRDGQVLAAHPWEELNWMMNFPLDNRRFSGVMLRRALHVNPDVDLAGRYTLSLRAGGEVLGERQLTILPELDVKVSPKGPQVEETRYTLTAHCAHPCFVGEVDHVTLDLGAPVVDRDSMENSPFQPRPLEGVLHLSVPYYDLKVGLQPEVVGFRLLDENEGSWIRKTMLSYDELGTITLVLFGTNARVGSLTVGDGEPLHEDFYEGFATFSLASVQETLREHETEVRVAVDGKPVGTLTVTWHPQILQFEAANEYLVDNVAQLKLQAVGPEDTPVRLEATAPDGRKLGTLEVASAGGEEQNVSFALLASRDYPVITIRAYVPTEASGIASGTVEVRNASFDPEIEGINKRIADDPQTAELRYERAQMLLARGLRKAAARDFQSAIELGMTELLDSPQYQQFMSQRRAESFLEDVKTLASFFVPFARKELNIG